MKKIQVLISIVFLCFLCCSIPQISADDEDIRIIQGAVYINDVADSELIEDGLQIKIEVSDGQSVIVTTRDYEEDDDLNYGKGFASIAAGETINFTVNIDGTYQTPDEITLNDDEISEGFLTISDETIYHLNIYFFEDKPFNPVPSHKSKNRNIDSNLSWDFDETGKDNVVYEIYFDTESPPDYLTNTTNKTFDPDELSYNTTYYWRINATIEDGYWQSSIWRFTTKIDPHPIVNAGGPYTAEVDQNIEFIGQASNGEPPYTFSWDFGDESSSTDQNPTHAYSTANTYTAIFSVTDDDGYTATDEATVTIEPSKPSTPNISITSLELTGPDNFDVGKEVELEITASHSEEKVMSFTIDWGDDTAQKTRQGLSDFPFGETHTYESKGEYTITVTASDRDYSSVTRSQTHTITIEDINEASGGIGDYLIYIIIVIIIVALAGVLFYLYQNDRLPIANKQSSGSQQSINQTFTNIFQKKKEPSQSKTNMNSIPHQTDTNNSIPKPVESSSTQSESNETTMFSQLNSSKDSKIAAPSKGEKKNSKDGSDEQSEFKRL